MGIRICMVCNAQLGTFPGKGVSHGYCPFHGLEALAKSEVATEAEMARYNAAKAKRLREARWKK